MALFPSHDQIGLHKSVAEAIYASDLETYRLKQENAVKRAVMLRYQELEKQSQRSLAKTYLDIMEDELGLMLTDWREKNPKATVKDTTKFLQSLVGQFVTVDSLEGGLDGGNTVNRVNPQGLPGGVDAAGIRTADELERLGQ